MSDTIKWYKVIYRDRFGMMLLIKYSDNTTGTMWCHWSDKLDTINELEAMKERGVQ